MHGHIERKYTVYSSIILNHLILKIALNHLILNIILNHLILKIASNHFILKIVLNHLISKTRNVKLFLFVLECLIPYSDLNENLLSSNSAIFAEIFDTLCIFWDNIIYSKMVYTLHIIYVIAIINYWLVLKLLNKNNRLAIYI